MIVNSLRRVCGIGIMKSFKVSVALCTYNGEKYLLEQLNSIAKQTIKPDEIIICDDLSNDHTINIINEFKKNVDFEVSLHINKQTLGSTKNFEKAITLCSGEIIFLADQDDIWLEGKIEKILETFSNNSSITMVFTDALLVDSNLQNLGRTLWESINFNKKLKMEFCNDPMRVLMKKNVVTGATMAFRKKYICELLPISNKWIHDAWIAFLLNSFTQTMFIDQCLIKYRQHDNNQIGASNKNLLIRVKEALKFSNSSQALELEKYKIVNDYLENMQSSNPSLEVKFKEDLNRKLELLHFRKSLPKNIVARMTKVIYRLLNKSYFKYSNGLSSALSDIFLKYK